MVVVYEPEAMLNPFGSFLSTLADEERPSFIVLASQRKLTWPEVFLASMTAEMAALLLSCWILTEGGVYLVTNVNAAKVLCAATYDRTRSQHQFSTGI